MWEKVLRYTGRWNMRWCKRLCMKQAKKKTIKLDEIPSLLPNNKVKPKKEVKNTWITHVCGSVEGKEVLKIVVGLRKQKDEKEKAKTDKLKDLLRRKKHSMNLRKSGNVKCKNVKLLV